LEFPEFFEFIFGPIDAAPTQIITTMPQRLFSVEGHVPPNFHHVTPSANREVKNFTTDKKDVKILKFLDANPSVVYISQGTHGEYTKKHVLEIARIAEKLPDYGIILNVGKEQRLQPSIKKLLDQSPNLLYVDWASTNALLRHNSTKIFVSHGGLNSVFESMLATVPLVVVPKAGDQWHNCKLVHSRHFGVCAETLDGDRIVNAVRYLDGNALVKRELQRARESLML